VYDNEDPALPDLERLSALAVPVLLIVGAEDLADFRLIAELIQGAAPDVRRIVIGSGHLPHLESPIEVIRQVRDFLS
jgi:2-succinyl-6-hydroxy-2,4-cyclohexadiene-1-carboxylate synthase